MLVAYGSNRLAERVLVRNESPRVKTGTGEGRHNGEANIPHRGMEAPSRQAAGSSACSFATKKNALGAWRTLAFNREFIHESRLEGSGVRECVEIAGK